MYDSLFFNFIYVIMILFFFLIYDFTDLRQCHKNDYFYWYEYRIIYKY